MNKELNSDVPNINIDFSQTEEIRCQKCGNNLFIQTFLLRKLPAALSPSGKIGILPFPVYGCSRCGWVNEELIPKASNEESEC